ncbi:hypothetical protein ILUMI_03085 [Ignelater luminosus]|uniref:Thioredoxin domain-containing protein 17 n=1 Tax=Ignelater luminosus TaxID=2038154 RepID=A0A8K0DH60_IGNLU|nr:hypothetical protein ILUMI_03085 [Ignelater luminosus]
MVIKHKVEGYDNFCEFMKNLKTDGEYVHVYFSGSKLPSGISWCEDCVRAHPVVEAAVDKIADPKSHFVYVEVGDRSTWKDMNCPFRKDSRTKLMVIPTLLRWGNPQRLEGEQCENPDLVEMLFTDE